MSRNDMPPEAGTALAERVAEAFADTGPLARVLPAFEPRGGQRGMAAAAADIFDGGGLLLVEAGTGIGKTLAYLVPAILSRRRVLVSTGTKNLQDQIYYKDLPALRDALGIPFTATYMKGRANYLCLHRFDTIRSNHELRSPQDRVYLKLIEPWAEATETGDRSEIEDLPDELPLWHDIAATSETCLGRECRRYQDCFITQMRQRAAESDVVIVNHHLLCADAAVRQSAYGEVIPACSYAVIDEAHQFEDVATQYFGVAVSNYRLDDLAGDVRRLLGGEAFAEGDRRDELRQCAGRLQERSRFFFAALMLTGPARVLRTTSRDVASGARRLAGRPRRPGLAGLFEEVATPPGGVPHALRRDGVAAGIAPPEDGMAFRTQDTNERSRVDAAALAPASTAAQQLGAALEALEATLSLATEGGEDARGLARRCREIRDDLRFLVRADDRDFVYFLELRGRGVFLRACPIDVSAIIRDVLLDRMQGTILTSATLTVGGAFDYIRGRLGIEDAYELRFASEFDYRSQAILYLPRGMPDPRAAGFAQAAGHQVVELLNATEGRAFVLFTSYANLRDVQVIVEREVSYPVLVQGSAPRSVLLREFRTTPHAVLLATSSFWQGVDVVGEALSCVIIDKLPFASPSDPITAARMEAVASADGDPFRDYQVPLAILTLLQGLGRLIRHRNDRGVLAILDPRIQTKGYGQRFLQSIPPAPITRDLADVRRFLAGS